MNPSIRTLLLRYAGFTCLWFLFGFLLALVYWRYVYDISGPYIWWYTIISFPAGLILFAVIDYCWRRRRHRMMARLLLVTFLAWGATIPYADVHYSNTAERVAGIATASATPILTILFGIAFWRIKHIATVKSFSVFMLLAAVFSYFAILLPFALAVRMLRHL